jgi:hypothetical protein
MSANAVKPETPKPDRAIIRRTSLEARGTFVDVYIDGDDYDAGELARLADSAYVSINRTFGFEYDHRTLGERIRLYCSDDVKVSHVRGGYRHLKRPLGEVLLNRRAAIGATRGLNATYIHELVHLFAWQFGSHTLREGLADHVACILAPGSAIGAVPVDLVLNADQISRYTPYLATAKNPPRRLRTDIDFRRGYYYTSRRFATHLIDRSGLDTFMSLYVSDDLERDIPRLYGSDRRAVLTHFTEQLTDSCRSAEPPTRAPVGTFRAGDALRSRARAALR